MQEHKHERKHANYQIQHVHAVVVYYANVGGGEGMGMGDEQRGPLAAGQGVPLQHKATPRVLLYTNCKGFLQGVFLLLRFKYSAISIILRLSSPGPFLDRYPRQNIELCQVL